jgi:hypothetical protein
MAFIDRTIVVPLDRGQAVTWPSLFPHGQLVAKLDGVKPGHLLYRELCRINIGRFRMARIAAEYLFELTLRRLVGSDEKWYADSYLVPRYLSVVSARVFALIGTHLKGACCDGPQLHANRVGKFL